MKKSILQIVTVIALVVCFSSTAFAQVSLNGTAPRGVLDLGTSSTQGFVFPRVDLTDSATATITQPDGSAIVTGTIVYNTASTGAGNNRVYPGLYVWTGSKWVTQTSRMDYEIATQDNTLRTGSDDGTYGEQNISFDISSFTPMYSGDYKIVVHVNYGGGEVDDPSGSGSQYVNINKQEGTVEFSFNGTDHTYLANSYSAKNYIPGSAITNNINQIYDDEVNQMNFVFIESLTEGVNYPFELTMNQDLADGFEADGDESGSLDGRGYISQSNAMYCTVEFTYIGN